MSGVSTLLCLLISGCQNIGKWRMAVKNGCHTDQGVQTSSTTQKAAAAPPPRSCRLVPHITAGVDISPGRVSEHLAGQQTHFGQGNMLRAEKRPVSTHSSVTAHVPFPSAGQRGTTPQNSRKKFSCFMVGRCNWVLLPEGLLKYHQPWVDFPDCILTSRFEGLRTRMVNKELSEYEGLIFRFCFTPARCYPLLY